MPVNPRQIANMQARYDRLSSMDNRSSGQQAAMDRIGGRLNSAATGVTGNAPMVQPPADIGIKPPFYRPPGVTRGVGPTDAPPGTGGPGMPFSAPVSGALNGMAMKKGGRVKGSAASSKGASSATKASSASKRADGIAQRGKTKGRYI